MASVRVPFGASCCECFLASVNALPPSGKVAAGLGLAAFLLEARVMLDNVAARLGILSALSALSNATRAP